MTTIAVDLKHGTIAADGQSTSGIIIRSKCVVKLLVGKNEQGQRAIFGVCGQMGMLEMLAEWVAAGAKFDAKPKSDAEWDMVIVDQSGVRQAHSSWPALFKAEDIHATGQGYEVAYGALDAGATPEQAVKIACARTNGSGGAITVINIAEALGTGDGELIASASGVFHIAPPILDPVRFTRDEARAAVRAVNAANEAGR
jgi:hypothetical protein